MKKNDKNLVFLFLISMCIIVFGLKMEVTANNSPAWTQNASLSLPY